MRGGCCCASMHASAALHARPAPASDSRPAAAAWPSVRAATELELHDGYPQDTSWQRSGLAHRPAVRLGIQPCQLTGASMRQSAGARRWLKHGARSTIETWQRQPSAAIPPERRLGGRRSQVSGTSRAAAAPTRRAALDTLPKLLLRNAAQYADRPAMRHKDLGIWQTWTWARPARRGARLRHRPAQARASSAATRWPSSATTARASMPPSPPCRASAASPCRLPGLGGRRDGLRARARRGEVRRRPEPGAGRQAHLGRRPPAEAAQRIIYDEQRGLDDLRPRATCIPSTHVQRAGPRGDAQPTPAPRAGGSTRSPRARAPTSA